MNDIEDQHKFFHLKKAVAYVLIAAFAYSTMTFLVKFVTKQTKIEMIIFFRFGISFLYALSIMGIRKVKKQTISLKTSHISIHISRALVALLSIYLLYTSLKYIPLVDGNLLVMTNAIFIPVIGALFLHHKVDFKHWIAIIIGFIGVAFVLRPGGELFNPMALLALASGLCIAISLLIMRRVRKFDDHYVLIIYYFSIAFITALILAIINWKTPNLHTALLLAAAGILGTLTQDFLIRASAHSPAKLVSALLYTTLIFSFFFDWLVWGHIPKLLTIIGIILIFFSSILCVHAARKPSK